MQAQYHPSGRGATVGGDGPNVVPHAVQSVRFRGAMTPHDEHTRIEPGPGEAAGGAAAASVVPQWLQKRASGGSGAPQVGQGRIP